MIFPTSEEATTPFNLGGLPGATASQALGINDFGLVVGANETGRRLYPQGYHCGISSAPKWSSGGLVSPLDAPPGAIASLAYGINDFGLVVGLANYYEPTPGAPGPLPGAGLAGLAALALAGFHARTRRA